MTIIFPGEADFDSRTCGCALRQCFVFCFIQTSCSLVLLPKKANISDYASNTSKRLFSFVNAKNLMLIWNFAERQV